MPWYYAHQGQRIGPVADDEFIRLAEGGSLPPNTLVWRDGMAEWLAWESVVTTAFPTKAICNGCGKLASSDDLVSIQGVRLCATCKPIHLQRAREGVLPLGTPGGTFPTYGDGKRIVVALKSPLPQRCVCCNASATSAKRRTFYWYPPWVYVLVLLSPIIMIIVGIICRRTTVLDIPLCDEHLQRRRKQLWIWWACGLGSVAGFIGSLALLDSSYGGLGAFLMISSIVLFFTSIILGQRSAAILTVKTIGKETATFTRASAEYIGSLPPWTGGIPR